MSNAIPQAHQGYNGNKMFLNNDEMTLKPLTLKAGYTGDVYYTVIGNELHFVGSINTGTGYSVENRDMFDIPAEFKNPKFMLIPPANKYNFGENVLSYSSKKDYDASGDMQSGQVLVQITGQNVHRVLSGDYGASGGAYNGSFPAEILAMTFTR